MCPDAEPGSAPWTCGASASTRTRTSSGAGRRCGVGVVHGSGDGLGDGTQLLYLLGSQAIKDHASHLLDVTGRGLPQGPPSCLGEDGELAPTVGRAGVAAHPAPFFEAGDGMRDPAL